MSENSLAQFISTKRDDLGLSQRGLARKANVPLSVVESIESGQELFLATSVRQKLAKALKLESFQIKEFEKPSAEEELNAEYIENIKYMILSGETQGVKCPVCKSKLICRVAEMYDLEDKLIRHPKARCSKCPFQIK